MQALPSEQPTGLAAIRAALAERNRILAAQKRDEQDKRDRIEGKHSFLYRDTPETHDGPIDRMRIFNDRRAWQ